MWPSVTMPSVAIFSPGRTTKMSPTTNCSVGIRISVCSLNTATSLAPMSISARRAAPDCFLARASKYRPASMKTVTAAATSR